MRMSEYDPVSSCYFREQDFCYISDDATNEGEYIDLSINPERFTGYAGDSAHHVWRAIYEENCFGLSEASLSAGTQPTPKGLSSLSEGWGTEMVSSDEGMCEEKKVYYRVISGEPILGDIDFADKQASTLRFHRTSAPTTWTKPLVSGRRTSTASCHA